MQVKRTVQHFVDNVLQAGGAVTRTTTGTNMVRTQITVTQASEVTYAIPGDIGSPRDVTVENKDTTNFLTVAFVTATPVIRVYAGETVTFSALPSATQLFFQADTADCEAVLVISED